MKMLLNNYENNIMFDGTCVNTIEILNKKAFYKFLEDITYQDTNDNILFIENDDIINLRNKITIMYDYVNFNFDDKKITSLISDTVNQNLTEKNIDDINKIYNKLKTIYNNVIKNMDIDFNIEINEDFDTKDISKLMKLCIMKKNRLIDNLLLIIDIESSFKLDKLVVFVNLKDYLEENDLVELYKYAIYKEVNILLIDNNKHKTSKYEKKLFIDEDLIEFML